MIKYGKIIDGAQHSGACPSGGGGAHAAGAPLPDIMPQVPQKC